jgi:snurportin-1
VITVDVPIYNTEPVSHWNLNPQNSTTASHPHSVEPMAANIQPDGLLLYVSEASFESGTSPLSSWIPITGYDQDSGKEKDPKEEERADVSMDGEKGPSGKEGPLDLFQRFVCFFSRCFWLV